MTGDRFEPELPLVAMDRVIATALEEDLSSGDITTEACVAPEAQAVTVCDEIVRWIQLPEAGRIKIGQRWSER